MIGGSWLSGRSLHRGNEVTGVLAGRAVMAVGIASVALMPVTGAVFACYVVGGLGGGFMGAASQSIVQRNVPDHLRGRVFGAMEAARNLAFGIGALMAGLIVSALGPVTTFGVVGIAVLVGLIPMARVVRDLGGLRSLRPAFSQ
jgi:MFS family permease